MELYFNSVEMSRKPNAEASSLGYAEVPLTFNSVETILYPNASAAFFLVFDRTAIWARLTNNLVVLL